MSTAEHFKLARRAAGLLEKRVDQTEAKTMALVGFVAFWLTAVVYYVVMIKIRYSLGALLGTLSIVEERERTFLVEREPSDDEENEKKATDGLLEPEAGVVIYKPVTKTIRTARAHLKDQFGRRAGFRGFGLFYLTDILIAIATTFLASITSIHLASLAAVAVEVAFAKLQLVWVHHIISANGDKKWTQRKESFAVPWISIAPAALLRAVAFQLVVGLPAAISCAHPAVHGAVHHNNSAPQGNTSGIVENGALMGAGSVVAALFLAVLVYVPAHVTFIRVCASLLPHQEPTHINFDRTFGGKVAHGDRIGLLDAWTTFSWEQRRRYLALWGKIFAICIAVTLLFGIVMVFEFGLWIGFAASINNW